MASAQGFSGHSANVIPLCLLWAPKSRSVIDSWCTFAGLHRREHILVQRCYCSFCLLPLLQSTDKMWIYFPPRKLTQLIPEQPCY